MRNPIRCAIVFMAVLFSITSVSCVVKNYPREVTAKEKVDTNVAYKVDTAGAKLVVKMSTGKDYDLSRQMSTVDYSYYLDPAFRKDPGEFYLKPEGLPKVETAEPVKETKDYTAVLVKWPSQYSPRNPAFVPMYESYPETQTAYGVYLKSKHGNKGAIVISHGWTGGDIRKSWKLEGLPELAEQGYDAVLIQQPYHGLRMPADSKFSGELFFSGEVARTNEAFCQTVTDVRSMVAWLRDQGYETVGLKGGSLGGITTLLTTVVEDRINFAVAWVPPSSLGDMPEDSPLIPFVIEGMRRSGLDQAKVREILYVSSPSNYQPAIPADRVLIIAGMGDNFVPPDQPEKIYEAWKGSHIFWFAGGHVLNFERKKCNRRQAEFIGPMLH